MLFPAQANNDYRGYKTAILFLLAAIALRLLMAYAALLDTHGMVQDADSIPIDSWGPGAAHTFLYMTKLLGLDHLLLTVVAIVILIRWRSLIPFAFLLLLAEQLGRFTLKLSNPIPRTGITYVPVDPNLIIIAALLIGLALSLSTPRANAVTAREVQRR